MADHSKPLTTSTYANFVSELDARFDDLAVGLDPAVVTPTNMPTNSIRWTSASNKWQKWSGSAWGDLSSSYDITVKFTPSGNLVATTVQAALAELDTEKQPTHVKLTNFAGLAGAADKVPYFTGSDTISTMTVTSTARTLLDDTSTTAMRTTLGAAASSHTHTVADVTSLQTTLDGKHPLDAPVPRTQWHNGGSTSRGVGYVVYPGGGDLDTTSSVTGAIKIGLPLALSPTNNMVRMRIEVWDYGTNESFTSYIAGYCTSTYAWSVQSVIHLTNNTGKDFTVRFGNDGTRGCVWIGELASTWAHMRFRIAEVMVTYGSDASPLSNYETGWSVSTVTAFDTVEDTISDNLPIAKTATTLQTARTIGMTGDVTWTSAAFNGGGNVTGTATLASTGVSAGTYPKVNVDVKGRVTGGSSLVASDIPSLDWSKITSGKPTTLAGYGITNAAPLASPALTGTPTAPTATAGTNTTQIATTAFVTSAISAAGVTTSAVLSATAGASVGAVGTYAFLLYSGSGSLVAGSTAAGSNLQYTNGYGVASGYPSGTWRLMGYIASPDYAEAFQSDSVSLWLRIS